MVVLKKFFSSRKFWAFAVGLVTLISAALEDGSFSAQEVQAISALVIGYIVSVAWEDGKWAEAQAQPTTTVTTPGESNVTVTATDSTGTPPVSRMGL